MLYWALIFFILAIVAGLLGFRIFAASAAVVGKVLFFLFVALSLFGLIMRFVRRRS